MIRSIHLVAGALAGYAITCGTTPPPAGRDAGAADAEITHAGDGGTSGDAGLPVGTFTVVADPSRIALGSGSSTTLRASGTFNGHPLPDGGEVTFTTDRGSFASDPDDMTMSLAAIVGGSAIVRLRATGAPGIATVTAEYFSPSGEAMTSTVQVTFDAGPVSGLRFSCAATNVGGFVPDADFAVPCDAVALDSNGQVVRSALVKFLAEAGSLAAAASDVPDGPTALHRPSPGSEPLDVAPLGDAETGEPRWIDSTVGRTHNPRDGLVTLVAYVETPGAAAQSEPYVDADDDGVHDPAEAFADVDGDAAFSPSQTLVSWKAIHVVWSGALDVDHSAVTAGGGSPGDLSIGHGAQKTLTFTLLDANLNALAATAMGDAIEWQLDSGTASLLGPSRALLSHAAGIDLALQEPSARASYQRGASYGVVVHNDLEDGASGEAYRLTASVDRSLGLEADGTPSTSVTESAPVVEGTLR